MTTIRVMIEMDLTVVDSETLRDAAATGAFEVEREAARRGVTFTSADELAEGAQRTDVDAVAQIIGLEPVLTTRPPTGTSLLRTNVRVLQLADGVPEGQVTVER